ncbi:hypothetical protein OGAPHI_000031 [Ogataea philodendri]|uniref:Uncharacterized protein n=1 Tax=Ogataea philodendri TaxID=1378263 RepID=A0A9P8PHY2_9ASCO|nr:uncharacterized protein OGAPHI_000031 [Ogataea philodendri]KAH3671845.1 hypothetical protein OGAPHI_000031 [Ogataea philodendri]
MNCFTSSRQQSVGFNTTLLSQYSNALRRPSKNVGSNLSWNNPDFGGNLGNSVSIVYLDNSARSSSKSLYRLRILNRAPRTVSNSTVQSAYLPLLIPSIIVGSAIVQLAHHTGSFSNTSSPKLVCNVIGCGVSFVKRFRSSFRCV